MATVTELSQRESEKTSEEQSLTRVFRVTVNSVNDGPYAAQTAVDSQTLVAVPRYGDPHPTAANATARNVQVRPVADSYVDFDVTVPYSTARGESPEQADENPLERPWDIEWDQVMESRAIESSISEIPDFDGLPIQSSAGVPFDPPYEISEPRPLLRITRWEQTFSAVAATFYTGQVNADVFYGQPPQSAKMMRIVGRREFESNAYYWRVTYEILFRPFITTYPAGQSPQIWSGHALVVLDRGKYRLDPNDQTKRKRLVDADGKPVVDDVLLDGSGSPLAPNSKGVFIGFSVCKQTNFAPLGLE